jgi:hypothetical protein
MVIGIDKAFEDWLDEPMGGQESRRQFAESLDMTLADLHWAFGGGWIRGQEQVVKELQNVLENC